MDPWFLVKVLSLKVTEKKKKLHQDVSKQRRGCKVTSIWIFFINDYDHAIVSNVFTYYAAL